MHLFEFLACCVADADQVCGFNWHPLPVDRCRDN
ncbi:GCG_CRPN prefix-to-repeats domain-containing protein [Nocardiopsis sp. NPDC101807]